MTWRPDRKGNLGLLRAVEGYDPVRDTRFSTYAAWWIKQAIKRALINSVQPIHIPAYMVEMIAKWKQASNELQAQFNRQPTLQELAEYMQLPERKVRIIRRAVKAFSFAQQSGGNGRELFARRDARETRRRRRTRARSTKPTAGGARLAQPDRRPRRRSSACVFGIDSRTDGRSRKSAPASD